jgi:hypothetical protein
MFHVGPNTTLTGRTPSFYDLPMTGHRRLSRRLGASTRRHFTAALLAAVGTAGAALANGDDYFSTRSSLFNPDGSRRKAAAGFFGQVKDDGGKMLKDATLTVAINVPTDAGVERVTYNAYTDVLGRYHTLDPAGVVATLLGLEVEVRPDQLEMVGVEAEGYVEMRRINRSRRGRSGPGEIDFIMTRAPG